MRRSRTSAATKSLSLGTEALLLAMAEPLAELAFHHDLPLGSLQQVVEEAYFARTHQTQTVAKAARTMGISRRKACQISRKVKLRTRAPNELSLLQALATGEVRSERQLARAAKLKGPLVRSALDALCDKGHVRAVRGGFQLVHELTRIVDDNEGRLALGLSHSLHTVSKVVLARLAPNPSPNQSKSSMSLARVVVFPAPTATLQKAIDLTLAQLMSTAKELDKSSAQCAAADRVQCSVSIFVATEAD